MKKFFALILATVLFTNVCFASTIGAGYSNSIAIHDGKAYTFGTNYFGQMNGKKYMVKVEPHMIIGLTNVKSVKAGLDFSLILLETGELYYVGKNNYAKLGLRDYKFSPNPEKIDMPSKVVDMSLGRSHALILDEFGNVYAYGSNERGQLGTGDYKFRSEPVKIYTGDVKKVECGENFSYILLNDGTALSFGANNMGQLALGNYTSENVPTKVRIIDGIKDISCSKNFSKVAVRPTGFMNYGSDGAMTDGNSVYEVAHMLSSNFTLFLKEDATVYGVGMNRHGQLGQGNYVTSFSVPVKINLAPVKAVSAGSEFSLFLMDNGDVYTCGYNNIGQLGQGNFDTQNVAKRIEITDVSEISANFAHSILRRSNGDVWGFGLNKFGALSTEDFIKVDKPILVDYIDNLKKKVEMSPFKDIATTSRDYPAVKFMYDIGVTKGTGANLFSPNEGLNRAQLLVMVLRAYEVEEMKGANFADAGDTYYTGYLATAKQRGIAKGVGGNMFAPEKEITREEMYTLLYNTLRAIGKLESTSTEIALSSYSGGNDVSPWAKDATRYMLAKGYLRVNDNVLEPKKDATRIDLARLLYEILR